MSLNRWFRIKPSSIMGKNLTLKGDFIEQKKECSKSQHMVSRSEYKSQLLKNKSDRHG